MRDEVVLAVQVQRDQGEHRAKHDQAQPRHLARDHVDCDEPLSTAYRVGGVGAWW